ncbi:MAG: hypothetical protein Q7U68_06770 [Candidatus Roizmanbacteria bacterium]|nr:hypothetical protein [Candidatus Roizmanbacteria bacterium]
MIEPSPESQSHTLEMTAYYDSQRKALREKTTNGQLKEISASNGTIYALPLSKGDEIPIAIVNEKLVIITGDEVDFKRDDIQRHLPVIDIMKGSNGEIEFRREAELTSSFLRIQDAVGNISAEGRQALQAKTAAVK